MPPENSCRALVLWMPVWRPDAGATTVTPGARFAEPDSDDEVPDLVSYSDSDDDNEKGADLIGKEGFKRSIAGSQLLSLDASFRISARTRCSADLQRGEIYDFNDLIWPEGNAPSQLIISYDCSSICKPCMCPCHSQRGLKAKL
ncbi:hypothetical protein B0H13DRAFT_2342313 [Mycena leptocephala]|nr:hypothetical protein B0H13DRAFT_2342313 [Mycena leptocephala]